MAFTAVIRRDLLLAIRHPAQAINPLLFLLLVITLFPLGVSPRRELLEIVAPGVFWIAALLATLLSLERMFRPDFEDGSLDLMLSSPNPLSLIVLAKIIAHWLVNTIPLLLVAPLFSYLLGLPPKAIPALLLTVALATPTLSATGAIGVALTTGLQRGGVLLSLLVLPLYVPVLVFATGALSAAANDLPFAGQLYILGALAALSCTLGSLVAGAALKIATS